VHRSARIPYLQRSRRRNRIRTRITLARETLSGLRQEVQVGLHYLAIPTSVHRSCGAIKLCALNPLSVGTHRCRSHAGQRGNLRHLQKEPGHRETNLDQLEQVDRPGHLFTDRFSALRRRFERGHHRVPDQPGAIPKNSLHVVFIRTRHLSREGLTRATVSGRDHQQQLRARFHDGQMRPQTRKVDGMLPHVQRRCCAQGCERISGNHQDQEDHPVRGLVPHRIQVRYQLAATHSGARR